MNFRTQLVNGKPQIYFDAIGEWNIFFIRLDLSKSFVDESATSKTRPKRNSRAINNANTNRPIEQKNKMTNQKSPSQNETKANVGKPTTKPPTTSKMRDNEDGSTMGVYMTMDELAELVKAVKENATSKLRYFFSMIKLIFLNSSDHDCSGDQR